MSASLSRRPSFRFVMATATLQGLAVHYLAGAATDATWPYTTTAAWTPLLLIAVFAVPAALLLGEWRRQRAMWIAVAAIALALGAIGLFHGSCVIGPAPNQPVDPQGEGFLLVLGVFALLFHALPFIQVRLATGRWSPDYPRLFAFAWHNTLALALTAAFMAVTWILLRVWAELFDMLGIHFFRVIFFALWPVTAYLLSVTAGASFVLASTAEKMRAALHLQVLALLKWFAVLAVFILVIFSLALAFEGHVLFTTHRHAISATWLLALTLITVYLYNAGYGDGREPQPYPPFIARALRLAAPLLVVVSLVALLGLAVRIDEYGLSVTRVLGVFVGVIATAYAVGYAWAARRAERWMGAIGTANVGVALGFIAVLAAMLSPVLSPYRLVADSMAARIIRNPLHEGKLDESPFIALRFEAGRFGRERLAALKSLREHPKRDVIRAAAAEASVATVRWRPLHAAEREPRVVFYPAESPVDPALRNLLLANPDGWCRYQDTCVRHVLLVDLRGTGHSDAVVLGEGDPLLYRSIDGRWTELGRATTQASDGCVVTRSVAQSLERGDYRVAEPAQRDLVIGAHTFAFPVEEDPRSVRRGPAGCSARDAVTVPELTVTELSP